jgi:hypothetical protein
VQELRELIELGAAKDAAERSNPGVVTGGNRWSQPFGVTNHGAQLEHPKRLAASSQAFGAIQDGETLEQRSSDKGEKQQRSPDRRQQQGEADIYGPKESGAMRWAAHSRARSSIRGSAAGRFATLPQ